MFQREEQDKNLKKNKKTKKELNKTKIDNLQDKEFKIMVIKILTEFRRRIEDHCETFNEEIKKIKKNKQTEMNNTITEIKNTLEGINRIIEAEE